MEALHQHILHIMAGQSPGYLIEPQAAAFIAIGLDDPQQIKDALEEMGEKGLVEYVTEETDYEKEVFVLKEQEDEDAAEEYERTTEIITNVTDWGWTLTAKGKKAIG